MLFECAKVWLIAGRDVRIGLLAMQMALSPEFKNSTTDPGFGNTITMRSGFLAKHELVEISGLWTDAVEVIQSVVIADWQPIQHVIEEWAYPGRVRSDTSDLDDMMRVSAGRMLQDTVSLAENRPGVLQWARQVAEAIDEPNLVTPIDEAFETLHPAWSPGDYRTAEIAQRAAVSDLATKWAARNAKDVAEQIARIDYEAQSKSSNWPNWSPLLCEEISQLVESPLMWAKSLIHAEVAGDLITPMLRRAAALDEEGWTRLASTCLRKPRLSLSIVSLVLTLKIPPDRLLVEVLENMDGAGTQINYHCLRNEVSEETLGRLLRHENADINSAAALGIWQAEPYGKVPDSLYSSWREAITNITFDSYWLGEILKGDSSFSFEWLEVRLSDMQFGLFRVDKAVNAAIDALNIDDRRKILRILPIEYPLGELVERLIGDHLDLYRELLNDDRLGPIHLCPLAGTPEGPWIDKARMALDAGYSPEAVAGAADSGSWNWYGEQSTIWQERIERFDSLLFHHDEAIQKVGELGSAASEGSRDRALARERQEAVRGFSR